MNSLLMKLLKKEDGAETAEWVLVVGLLVGIMILTYTGILQNELSSLTAAIGTTISNLVP